MNLHVNGEPREVPDGLSVAGLLEHVGPTARHVAVEVNRELVPKRDHETHVLADGDQVEIVTLVGGG